MEIWILAQRIPGDNAARKCPPPQQVGARIPKQAASISPASLKRQEEVLPMAKLEQRRYKQKTALTFLSVKKLVFMLL
ncbi:MAG: hypothetical protein ILA30_07505 [Selenomonas sp.]|nr:hypothetical protein [Selenomonas sp.]